MRIRATVGRHRRRRVLAADSKRKRLLNPVVPAIRELVGDIACLHVAARSTEYCDMVRWPRGIGRKDLTVFDNPTISDDVIVSKGWLKFCLFACLGLVVMVKCAVFVRWSLEGLCWPRQCIR